MPNLLGLAGGSPQKQTRFAPIYNGRWSSGIWTNRSPLRDAATTRLTEKYYGAAGDALIAGSNVEITNRLTLGRRPGNDQFDSVNDYTSVDRFYDFRLFNSSSEQIDVMIDQASALYSLYNGTKTLVFTKSSGAGPAYMQSVGNSLYFGDGVDNKKWLQTLNVWAANFDWTTFNVFSTFIIDENNNIQQLTTAGVSDATEPAWSTQQPNDGNFFTGGTTTDGTAVWTNRGNPIENWGIANPAVALSPEVGSSRSAWKKNTFYSIASVVIDSNGNLQQVTTEGLAGSSTPSWANLVGNITTDGSVVWTMIQTAASMVWQPSTTYASGHFIIGNASGQNCLFQLQNVGSPFLTGNVSAYIYNAPHTGPVGQFIMYYPTSTGSALASDTTLTSLQFAGQPGTGLGPIEWGVVDGAGTETGTVSPFPSFSSDLQLIILANIVVTKAGQYSFSMTHHDGMVWGIGGGATLVSGTNDNPLMPAQTQTAANGYPVFGGTNRGLGDNQQWNDNFVVNFPTAGTYGVEIDFAYWFHIGLDMILTCNGQVIANGPAISSTTEPIWPSWSTSFAPSYPTISESVGRLVWQNIGPTTDFVWTANISYTLPSSTIVDPAGNTEFPYRTGFTGTIQPTFATTVNQLTVDNPNLTWINQGPSTAPAPGTVSTFNGGWQYVVALVNTLDNTVSNASQISAATGNFIGATGVTFEPADGFPDLTKIDTQADYVAIFRTTDGGATPFLIPGTNPDTPYTLTLSDYLQHGYVDTTPDTGLNNLISAPIAGENTPPAKGAINLTYHLSRVFYSIGNVVYWTAGPDTPVGNGVNGTPPLNFDTYPSLVKRLVPTNSGLMVFTVSDVYIITGDGTANNPILPGRPVLQGVGLLSYDALDVNGSVIGFFSSDSQFIILDPSAGVTYAGFPIGDQLRQNNGQPGTAWNPATVYVAWHVEGEDQAWYVADGQFGWYRLMPTPAPESGLTWSPYATIVGGVKAVDSVEVTPGVHRLLLGPTGTGKVLKRNLDVYQDNGQNFPASATVGSAVLAQPGQLATVQFITTDSVTIGTPLTLGVLMDEAVPYYKGPFDTLKVFTNDPPDTTPSKSLISQRFYMNDSHDPAVCRHMQIKLNWQAENAPNEILTMTVFGGYLQEG